VREHIAVVVGQHNVVERSLIAIFTGSSPRQEAGVA
jgi:hypothetical protein